LTVVIREELTLSGSQATEILLTELN